MARKVSERQRLLTYAMTADKEQIEEALDIFKTALASRFEKKERKRREVGDASKSVVRRLAAQTRIEDVSGAAVKGDLAAAGKGVA